MFESQAAQQFLNPSKLPTGSATRAEQEVHAWINANRGALLEAKVPGMSPITRATDKD